MASSSFTCNLARSAAAAALVRKNLLAGRRVWPLRTSYHSNEPSAQVCPARRKPAKAAGLSLPNVESDLLQGALPIRLEVIGSTWRCIKQKRDVRVLLWERPQFLTASDLWSRPNIAASIVNGVRIVALLPRSVVALSARTLPVPLRSCTPTV